MIPPERHSTLRRRSARRPSVALHAQAIPVAAGHLHHARCPVRSESAPRRCVRHPDHGRLVVGDVTASHHARSRGRLGSNLAAQPALGPGPSSPVTTNSPERIKRSRLPKAVSHGIPPAIAGLRARCGARRIAAAGPILGELDLRELRAAAPAHSSVGSSDVAARRRETSWPISQRPPCEPPQGPVQKLLGAAGDGTDAPGPIENAVPQAWQRSSHSPCFTGRP